MKHKKKLPVLPGSNTRFFWDLNSAERSQWIRDVIDQEKWHWIFDCIYHNDLMMVTLAEACILKGRCDLALELIGHEEIQEKLSLGGDKDLKWDWQSILQSYFCGRSDYSKNDFLALMSLAKKDWIGRSMEQNVGCSKDPLNPGSWILSAVSYNRWEALNWLLLERFPPGMMNEDSIEYFELVKRVEKEPYLESVCMISPYAKADYCPIGRCIINGNLEALKVILEGQDVESSRNLGSSMKLWCWQQKNEEKWDSARIQEILKISGVYWERVQSQKVIEYLIYEWVEKQSEVLQLKWKQEVKSWIFQLEEGKFSCNELKNRLENWMLKGDFENLFKKEEEVLLIKKTFEKRI